MGHFFQENWYLSTFATRSFKVQKMLTTPSIVLPLHLKQAFPPIIWIFTEGEGDGSKSRLPFKIFSTLKTIFAINDLKYQNNIRALFIISFMISGHWNVIHAIWLYKDQGKCFSTSGPYIFPKFQYQWSLFSKVRQHDKG